MARRGLLRYHVVMGSKVTTTESNVDMVFCSTFAAWRLGTLQARALPLAQELRRQGLRCVIVTTPWDLPAEAGVVDTVDGVTLSNSRLFPFEPIGIPLAVLEQQRLIRSLSPMAVHVFKPRGYGGLAGMAVRNRLPLLVDSDDWEGDGGWNRVGSYSLLQRRMFDWQERSMLRRAYGVSAASWLLFHRAREIRAAGPGDGDATPVLRLPNALSLEWYGAFASALRPEPDACPTIVLYSRFAEFSEDWLPRFVAVLSEAAVPQLRLRVIGSTGRLVGTRTVAVDQLGYVAREQLPELLAGAHIAVVPHDDQLVGRAKQSVKLLELMAAGCPIVTSDVGDVADVTAGSSVLLRSNDPALIANAALRLLSSPESVERMSAAARSRVRDHYLIPRTASQLVRWYRELGVAV